MAQSWHIVPYCVISCEFLSHGVSVCHIMSQYGIIWCHAMPYYAICRHMRSYLGIGRHIVLYHGVIRWCIIYTQGNMPGLWSSQIESAIRLLYFYHWAHFGTQVFHWAMYPPPLLPNVSFLYGINAKSHVMAYHAIPHWIIFSPFTCQPVISCHILPYYVISCHIRP